MAFDTTASEWGSKWVSDRSEVIGCVVLSVALVAIGKWVHWFLPASHWQRCVLALAVSAIEIGLPGLLMWLRPATARFDGQLLPSRITPWLLALPLAGALLLTDVASWTLTTRLDGNFKMSLWNDHVIPGLSSPAIVVAQAIQTIMITPIAEEFFFRGFLLGQLRKIMPAKVAVLVQAILFAAFHLGHRTRSARLTGALVMGVAFGAWRLRFTGLLPLMLVHGIINAMAFLPMAVREYDIVSLPECRQMEALKEEPAERAIPLIVEQLGHPDIRVQSGANVILTTRYRDAAGPYLREALSSSNPDLVTSTMRLAGWNNYRELVPEICRLAWDHESQDVQVCAILQLMLLGETVELESIAADHPQPKIRRAASQLVAPRESQ